MEKILAFLKENPVQILATVDEEERPRCRPFQMMHAEGGKLWFCTNTEKKVYRQMQHNPQVEICVCSPHSKWLRITGWAVFEDNHAIKEICMKNALVRKLYGTADNPIFTVFYLADAHAVLADFSGQPPYEADLSAAN